MKATIPKWIIGWTVLIGLLPLAFTVIGYSNPAAIFGEEAVAPGISILSGPIGLWLARDMASVVITFYALYARSPQMIIMACLLRISTDAMDVINNLIAGTMNADLWIFAPFFIVISSIVIVKLNKLENENHAMTSAS
jgi:hypothetical protein